MIHKPKLGAEIYYTSMYENDVVVKGVVTQILDDRILIRWNEYTNAAPHHLRDAGFWQNVAFCCNMETL